MTAPATLAAWLRNIQRDWTLGADDLATFREIADLIDPTPTPPRDDAGVELDAIEARAKLGLEKELWSDFGTGTIQRVLRADVPALVAALRAARQRIAALEGALDFAEAAIRDAITLEDGLDASDAQGALDTIAAARRPTPTTAPAAPGGATE